MGYDCGWYANGDNCGVYGHSYPGVLGQTANQACCVCQTSQASGGGSGGGSGSYTTVSQPSAGGSGGGSGPQYGSGFELAEVSGMKQTVFLEGGCTNTPSWHDADGETYNCDWYANGDNCGVYGHSYPGVGGQTANQACCVCQTDPLYSEASAGGSGGGSGPQYGSGFELAEVSGMKQTIFLEGGCT